MSASRSWIARFFGLRPEAEFRLNKNREEVFAKFDQVLESYNQHNQIAVPGKDKALYSEFDQLCHNLKNSNSNAEEVLMSVYDFYCHKDNQSGIFESSIFLSQLQLSLVSLFDVFPVDKHASFMPTDEFLAVEAKATELRNYLSSSLTRLQQ